jgi:hypothetical protein
MNILKDWKAKLESAYSFMLKYSKITVCTGTIIQIIQDMYYGLNEGLGLGSLRL